MGYTIRYNPDELDALTDRLRQEVIPTLKSGPIIPSNRMNIMPSFIWNRWTGAINERLAMICTVNPSVVKPCSVPGHRNGILFSEKVQLVQEIDNQIQAGFLIYVPVYRDGSFPQPLKNAGKNCSVLPTAPSAQMICWLELLW